MVEGALTRYALLHTVFDSKTEQIRKYCLNWDFMIYEFKPGHNVTEATKDISWVKSEVAVVNTIVRKWFNKFCSDTRRSSKAKNQWILKLFSKPLRKKKTTTNIREYTASMTSVWFATFITTVRKFRDADFFLTLTKLGKTFGTQKYQWSPLELRSFFFAQSVGALENTDCITAEE